MENYNLTLLMGGVKSLNSNPTNITIEEVADELINYDFFSEKYDEVENLEESLENLFSMKSCYTIEDDYFTWVIEKN